MAGLLEYLLASHMGGPPASPIPGMMPAEEPPIDEAALAEEARRLAAARMGRRIGKPAGEQPIIPGAGLLSGLMSSGAPQGPGIGSIPFATAPAGFDALDTPAGGDLTAEGAREAAAARMVRSVKRPSADPFTAGTSPIPGIEDMAGLLSTGGGAAPTMDAASGNEFAGAPRTNDPLSGEPQVVTTDVPLPRPRPDDAPMPMVPGEAELPPNATPTQGRGMPMEPAGPSLFDRIFDPNKAATWMALGSGFAGAGSIGSGMRRAFGNAVPAMALDRAQAQKSGGAAETYRALVAKGVAPQEALAATRSPELLKALVAKHFPAKTTQVVNNRIVEVDPAGGGVRVIADLSDKKEKPPAGFKENRDGTLSFVAGGPADPAYKKLVGDKANAPPGYRWQNPDDPKSNLIAIEGGPAEKVDSQVAARLGLAQSFRDQLPEIRASVARGEATGLWDAVVAKAGYGRPGELKRQIQSGAEALLRNLTGAGMNLTEAQKYVSRYELQAHDTAASMISKLDQLGRELIYTDEAVKKGRGGTIKIVGGKLSETTPASISGKTGSGIVWSAEP